MSLDAPDATGRYTGSRSRHAIALYPPGCSIGLVNNGNGQSIDVGLALNLFGRVSS